MTDKKEFNVGVTEDHESRALAEYDRERAVAADFSRREWVDSLAEALAEANDVSFRLADWHERERYRRLAVAALKQLGHMPTT